MPKTYKKVIYEENITIVKVLYEKEIDTKKIKVSPRPVWKCTTCPFYGKRPSCPPYAPSWRDAREWVHSYKRALLLKFEINMEDFENEKRKILNYLLKREKELFKEHSYVYALFPGACNLCEECEFEKSGKCPMPEKVRFSLDAIGIEITSMVSLDFGESALYSLIFLD